MEALVGLGLSTLVSLLFCAAMLLLWRGDHLLSQPSIVRNDYTARMQATQIGWAAVLVGGLLSGAVVIAALFLLIGPLNDWGDDSRLMTSLVAVLSLLISISLLLAGWSILVTIRKYVSTSPSELRVRKRRMLRLTMWLYAVLATVMGAAILVTFIGTFGCFLFGIVLALWGMFRQQRQFSRLMQIALAMRGQNPFETELAEIALRNGSTSQARFRRMIDQIQAGSPIGDALMASGLISHNASKSLKIAGDQQSLGEVLWDVAQGESKRLSLSTDEIESRMMVSYTASSLVMVCGIVGFLLYSIVPKYRKIFEDFGATFPKTSASLFAVSEMILFEPIGLVLGSIVACLLLLIFGARCFWGQHEFRWRFWGRFFARQRIPILLRSLAAAVGRQQSLIPVFELAAQELPYRGQANSLLIAIQAGENPWDALQNANLLSGPEAKLLNSAEQTGHLEWALSGLANTQEQRWSFWGEWISKIAIPAIIFTLGVIIAYIVFGMFLPLIKLLNDMS